MSEEGIQTTPNHMIYIGKPIDFDEEEFLSHLKELMIAAQDGKENGIADMIASIVNTYKPYKEGNTEQSTLPKLHE